MLANTGKNFKSAPKTGKETFLRVQTHNGVSESPIKRSAGAVVLSLERWSRLFPIVSTIFQEPQSRRHMKLSACHQIIKSTNPIRNNTRRIARHRRSHFVAHPKRGFGKAQPPPVASTTRRPNIDFPQTWGIAN